MKYIKIFLISIVIFIISGFAYTNDVSASCLPGEAGYPNCNTSGSGSNSGNTSQTNPGYPKDPNGCSTYCQTKLPSSPGQWSSCTTSCQAAAKTPDPGGLQGCLNKCNNTSSADKSVCYNKCNTTYGTPEPSKKPTESKKPSSSESEDNKYKPGANATYVCNGMLSTALRDELVKIYKTISLVMVVALIIFGMLDFFKAVSSGDADVMKKSTKKFVNRLIIVVIIVMLPIILDFLLTLFGDSNMKNCLNYFA